MRSDRGVTEVLGFVLIFSMILLMTGIIYTGGAAELREVRDNQQIEGAERALRAVDSDVTDIVRDGAPSRSSTVRFDAGRFEFAEPTRLNITVRNAADDVLGQPYNDSYTSLVYRFDGDVRLAYGMGMVTRTGGSGGWAAVTDPPVVFVGDGADRSVLLPVINTMGSGESGSGTVTVRTNLSRNATVSSPAASMGTQYEGDLSVTVNVTDTPRAAAWGRYFNRSVSSGTPTCAPVGEDGTSCTFAAGSFRAPAFPVRVSFT